MDFMPIRIGTTALVRILKGVRGTVAIRSELKLRFDYGSIPPFVAINDERAVATVGPDRVVLYSPRPPKHRSGHDRRL